MTFPPIPRGVKDWLQLGTWLEKLQTFGRDVLSMLATLYEPEVHQMFAAGSIDPSWDVVEYVGSQGVVITLPSAARIAGRRSRPLLFLNNGVGVGSVTLAAQAGQTVAGTATMAVPRPSLTILVSNGALGWRCVGGNMRATSLVLSGSLVVDGNAVIGAASTTVGFHGAGGTVQAAAIAAPTGGATIDAESRTAINSIRAVLSGKGFTA